MNKSLFIVALGAVIASQAGAQFDSGQGGRPRGQGGPQGGFPGGPQGGPMGGPGMRQEFKVVKKFDKDGNGWLNKDERAEARVFVKQNRPAFGRGGQRPNGRPPQAGFPGGPQGGPQSGFPGSPMGGPMGGPPMGGPGGGGRGMPEATTGPLIFPDKVPTYPKSDLYDPSVVKTIFLKFENRDWESELEDFHNTDVEVPAQLTIDGITLKNVGVSFRGASSYMMVPAGHKRSLNISLDMDDDKQRISGVKTLNLLNSNGDASYLSSFLYSSLARKYIPAPRANHVRLAINNESWGVYVNVEQFNNDFIKSNFKSTLVEGKSGARWKVSGSPMGDGGLYYLGENVQLYKQRYELKSKENEDDWKSLINLTKVLTETPIAQLESALRPILDLDGALWFLALDNGLMNSDGYWIRASDYSIYKEPSGKFHLIPHDMNEAFRAEGGPGGMRPGQGGPGQGGPGQSGMPPFGPLPPDMGDQFEGPPPGAFLGGPQRGPMGGPGNGPVAGQRAGANMDLDPFVGLDQVRKPLRSRLLQVPSLRAKYLANLKQLASDLQWSKLGPLVTSQAKLIEPILKTDTRKNSTFEAFQASVLDDPNSRGLRRFAELRSRFLLGYTDRR